MAPISVSMWILKTNTTSLKDKGITDCYQTTTPHKQRFLTPGHQGWNDLHSLCRIGMEYYLLNNDDKNIIYWIMMIQCKHDISRSRISRNWIYRGRMLDPIFWRPRARYFLRNRGNSLDPIRGRQFFAKSAHRDSLCSRFAGDNFSQNQLKPTCQCGLEHMLCDGQPR